MSAAQINEVGQKKLDGTSNNTEADDEDKMEEDDSPSSNIDAQQSEDSLFIGGLLLIAGAGLIFSFMTVLTAVAGHDIGSFEIMFISGAVRWVILAFMVRRSGDSPFPQQHQRMTVLLRCMCGFVGFSCSLYSFTKMPIGDASAIIFSAPVWASLLSRIFLKEPLGYMDMMAIAVGLTGVVLVAQPSTIFGDATDIPEDASSNVTDFERRLAPFVAILGSIGAGSAVVCIRLLGMQGGLKPVVLAHAYGFAVMMWAPLGFLFPGQSPKFDLFASATWIAVGVGLMSSVNQVMFNTGMMRVPASIGSMMRNIDIVASYTWQVLIFGQSATLFGLLGSGLIVVTTVAQAIRKLLEQRKSASESDRPGKDLTQPVEVLPAGHCHSRIPGSEDIIEFGQPQPHENSPSSRPKFLFTSKGPKEGNLSLVTMAPSKYRRYRELAEEGEGAEF
jgi:drug/metabolite transporter (DMT)-like permease